MGDVSSTSRTPETKCFRCPRKRGNFSSSPSCCRREYGRPPVLSKTWMAKLWPLSSRALAVRDGRYRDGRYGEETLGLTSPKVTSGSGRQRRLACTASEPGPRRAVLRNSASSIPLECQLAASMRFACTPSRPKARSPLQAARHLIEQPILGTCSAGASPVSATCFMASKSSRLPPSTFPARYQPSTIAQGQVGVETEEVRRANRMMGFGHLLRVSKR